MGTVNYYVFKSKLHDNFNLKYHNMTNEQCLIIEFYNTTAKYISCHDFIKYFIEWKNLLCDCININLKESNDMYLYKFKCDCGFKFNYILKDDQFEITCQNSKANIIDVICEHLPCLITKKKFIEGTLKMKSYKKWIKNRNSIL
jgi:hypothetical protein